MFIRIGSQSPRPGSATILRNMSIEKNTRGKNQETDTYIYTYNRIGVEKVKKTEKDIQRKVELKL